MQTLKISKICRSLCVGAMMLIAASASAQHHDDRTAYQESSVNKLIHEPISTVINERAQEVSDIISYAHKFLGVRYRRGANGPKAFDCSGFTSYVFGQFGYKLNRSSSGQGNDGVRVKRSDIKSGDIVLFNGRARGSRIGHVGIITKVNKDNTFEFIHASCNRGITVSKSTESYYACRYVGATRVVKDIDNSHNMLIVKK